MSSPPTELRVEREGAAILAHVDGDIDIANARDLREQLVARTPNDALGLVLDLTRVEYLDSAGIQLVHRLGESLRAGGQELVLVIPAGSPIRATLRLAGLDWSRDIVESPGQGAERLRPPVKRAGGAEMPPA